MAIGRITGPLLKSNLLRNGVNLGFENDLLYIDVINGRIGINTATPSTDLQVNGTARTTNLEVTTQATIGVSPGSVFTLSSNTIASTNSVIQLTPSGLNPVVYQGKLTVNNNLQLTTNAISTVVTNANLNFNTSGTGQVNVNSNMLVSGDLHATGTITADGDITIGDSNTDNIVFNADINSSIIPNNPLGVPVYDLGSDPGTGGKAWRNSYLQSVIADSVATDSILVNGIYLALPQGNIIYVAKNGEDTNLGVHENDPFLTVKKALSVATEGTTVYIYPGSYEEIFPLEVPPGVTIRGTGLRSVTITPTAATRYLDGFHMNGEATIEDITMASFYHDPTGTYAEFPGDTNGTGHAFRFSFGTIITSRSPYVKNISVITTGTPSVLSVDSIKTEVIASLNRIKSVIPDIVQNIAVTATTGNTRVQNISLATSNSATGTLLQDLIDTVVYVINNGTLRTSEPAITANGVAVSTGMLYKAAQILEANRLWIVDESYAYAQFTYPGVCDETLTKRDMGLVLDALIYDIIRGGNEHSYYAGFRFWVQPTNDPRGYLRGDAGHGALIDAEVLDISSTTRSMLFHAVTFITPAAESLIAKNGARVEWLNSFTYFADKGLYLTSSDAGFAGQGKTKLRIDTRTGTWAVGNTVSYYDTDGATLLASGVIDSIDSNYVNLTGRQVGFETITDRVGKTVYAQGNAKLSVAQKKFGTASLVLDGTGDYASIATQPDFAFGTGDFCLEAWVYPTSTGSYRTLFDTRTATPSDGGGIVLGITDANQLYFYYNFGFRVGPVGTISQNTWTHIALSKVSGNTRAFINGTQVGSTYVDTNSYAERPVRVGADPAGNFAFTGYIDDVRISKGVARYTTTFTAPTTAFTGDLNTVLLLHFNGNNNTTTILDDGVTLQDVRTSAGGTASLINFADYSEFGAELRSIGSAAVYGTYGAYGDGVGVTAYLVSQNFAYVGAGRLSTNDPNDRISANEVVELNGAKIYRTSVDNEGNFKVGNNFFINQKTGEVLFDNQNLTVTSLNGVTFTDGVHTTTITSTDITTGNIVIYDNNIDSLTGDINVTAASGAINLQNNTYVTGNLNVTGDVNIGGNITIGDQTTDTVSFVASINSNLIPATTAFYDLGTTALRWKTAFLNRAEIDNLVIDSNTISTTSGNDDLTLIANGTGRIYVPSNNVQIDQSLTVTNNLTVTSGTSYLKATNITGAITQTGNINQTGNFVTSGNTQVTGNITATGTLQLPQILISGNTVSTRTAGTDLNLVANGSGNVVAEGIMFNNNNIQSVATNSNITLVPQGTGGVVVSSNQSVQIPVGTTAQRPGVGTATNGMIRYNTDLTRYEGYNNGYWVKLGGLQDVDGNTKILAEATPGANDNTLYFYADGNLTATIDSTKLFTQRFQTVNLDIYNNTISPISASADINLTTTGTGGVRMGNFKIFNNSINNTVANAVTEFVQSGTGYVRIGGVSGVVIPSGDTQFQRPTVAVTGMMRFNTDYNYVEVYNGVTWTSVAGASGGVTSQEATEIGILSAIIYG
jgi:hypothetical protein